MRTQLLDLVEGVGIAVVAACGGPGPVHGNDNCTIDDHCTDPTTPFCVDGACHECKGTSDCAPDRPRCSPAELTCAACVGDVDCTGYPDATHCATDGACVGCIDDAQCTQAAPVCDAADHACRGCGSDDECPSAVCETTTGTCVAADLVLYVSATGAPTGACTMAETCTIAKAITLVDTAHRYVKLAGGNYPVGVDVTDKQFTMHATGATIGGGFQVADTSDITIRGADIPGGLAATSATATPKITFEHVTLLNIIANPATVTLRDSRITPGTQNSAVSAQTNGGRASSITLERTIVDGGDGMCIQGTSQLHVTNSVIANQIPNSSLLYCNEVGGVTGQITIAQSTLYEAPIACGTGTANVHLINTIVARTGSADAVTGSRCELAYTLVTPSTTALIGAHILQNADPMFTSPTTGDFHLRVGSAAIDAADPTTTPIPDLDGTPRPQGAAVDLGAFEYKPLM